MRDRSLGPDPPPMKPALALLALLLASACVLQTWHMASLPDQDVRISSPDVSRIYVLRADNSAGNLRRMIVFDDEQQIGSLNEDEYVCWERLPGHSHVSVFYERPDAEGGDLQTVAEIETAAGEVRYYAIELRDEASVLAVVPVEGEERGRELVAERYVPQTL